MGVIAGGGTAGESAFILICAVVSFLLVLLCPTKFFIVENDAVCVMEGTLVGIREQKTIFPREGIRRIRYWSDAYPDYGDDSNRPEMRYFLDLITRDGQIINLLTSSNFPIDKSLGKRIASRLRVEYVEVSYDPRPY